MPSNTVPRPTSPTGLVNKTLGGRYELLELLGEGNLFAAFRARDTAQNRALAIKTLLPVHEESSEIITALREGIGQVVALNYVGIARPVDVGADAENGVALFVAEEYVRGIDLKERIRRGAPFTHTVAVDVAIAIADALVFAAERDVCHGDLRPAHVLTGPESPIKVTAWGVAAAQAIAASDNPELLKPAAAYMAPELWASGSPTHSADLYALGMMLYEMLTGGLPFVGDNPLQIARRHIEASVPSPRAFHNTIPPALDGVTQKLLAKRPQERYASATALLDDLRTIRDALRFGRSLAWSPLGVAQRPEFVPPIPDSALFDAAGTAVMPIGKSERPGVTTPEDAVASESVAVSDVSTPLQSTVLLPAVHEEVRYEPDPTPDPFEEGTDVDDVEENELLSSAMPAPTRKGKSFSWLTTINLILATIFVATCGYVVQLTFVAMEPPTDVIVPELVGKSLTDAKALAAERKFIVEVVGDEYSDKFPADTIYQMRPETGRHIRENKKVTVWVSKGPRMVSVPDVRDTSFEKARDSLEKIGLHIGDKRYDWDPLIAKGNVVDQSPTSAENRPRGTRVDLVLSKGPEPVEGVDASPEPAPTAAPPVAETGDEDSKSHSLTLQYKIPDDATTHNIRVDVTDRDGTRTIYTQSHAAGDTASVDVEGIGKKITFRLYDNDVEVAERSGPPFPEEKKTK